VKYRMYVDEVGNPDLNASYDHRHRHLSLTGVIIELGHVVAQVFPRLEDLKRRFFGSHPDNPIILHRKDLVNARPPFQCLRDPPTRTKFDSELLQLLAELDYVVITVVIDKQAHVEQYRVWQYDPYHYCMKVLLERYVMWLQGIRAEGDVMAESRGGKEDRRLKASFLGLTEAGTEHIGVETFQRWLTSKQLKGEAEVEQHCRAPTGRCDRPPIVQGGSGAKRESCVAQHVRWADCEPAGRAEVPAESERTHRGLGNEVAGLT